VSKEIATATPTETVMLQDSSDNRNKINSDAGSLYKYLNAEPLGKESNDNRESKALA
jgi:hypothetical protein